MGKLDDLEDDLKDAIVHVISEEYYHRAGGERRHLLEGIEIVLGAIVTAFLVPYLKKLAELAATETYKKLKGSDQASGRQHSTDEQEAPSDALRKAQNASPADRSVAVSIAAEHLRMEMSKYNFSEQAQSLTLERLSVQVGKLSQEKEE